MKGWGLAWCIRVSPPIPPVGVGGNGWRYPKLESGLFSSGVPYPAVDFQVCCFLLEDGGGLRLFFVAEVKEGRKEGIGILLCLYL